MQLILHQTFPDNLKEEWNALLKHSVTDVPFLRWEYLNAWWQTRGGAEWPQAEMALVSASEDGRLCAAAPLFFTPNHAGRPSLLFIGSIEVSDYLDFLAGPQHLQPFLEALLPFLETSALPAWQVLDLYNIQHDSPTLAALQQVCQHQGRSLQVERIQPSPYITLPGNWEAYLAGIDKKQRHEIRRKMRRLEESGVPWRWYIVSGDANLEDETEDFLRLMEQEQEKAGFLTAEMRQHMRLAIRAFCECGMLHLSFLEIDGAKAAAKLCCDYNGRIWAYNSGIDRQHMEYSPGWVLLGHLLRWCNEQQRAGFDFMRGGEEYKYRFGAVDRFVMRAAIQR